MKVPSKFRHVPTVLMAGVAGFLAWDFRSTHWPADTAPIRLYFLGAALITLLIGVCLGVWHREVSKLAFSGPGGVSGSLEMEDDEDDVPSPPS